MLEGGWRTGGGCRGGGAVRRPFSLRERRRVVLHTAVMVMLMVMVTVTGDDFIVDTHIGACVMYLAWTLHAALREGGGFEGGRVGEERGGGRRHLC